MQGSEEMGAAGPWTALQAAQRDFIRLEAEYNSLHEAAPSLERKEELTTKYQPMLEKGASS